MGFWEWQFLVGSAGTRIWVWGTNHSTTEGKKPKEHTTLAFTQRHICILKKDILII
jgi:hypothetical protein